MKNNIYSNKIEIAIIDNGINESVLSKPLKLKAAINNENELINDDKEYTRTSFEHGTNCGLIIEKFSENYVLSSIKILDDKGIGNIEKLKEALKYCYINNIKLINLSLGTTNFVEQYSLRSLINEYANKGMIIIAASSNDKYTTYPASFSNVVGVEAGVNFKYNTEGIVNKGIEFLGISDHELTINNESFKIGKSNSYAAPYITALVSEILYIYRDINIGKVKKKLFKLCSNYKMEYMNPNLPDWITTGYLVDFSKTSNEKFYFSYIEDNYEKYKKHIDTIIFKDLKNISKYEYLEKNIVYLGNELLNKKRFEGFFWSKEIRINQIKRSSKRKGHIEIPIILVSMDNSIDIFLILKKIAQFFIKDGYNPYVISKEIESVLYDLEYIPEEFFDKKENDQLYNFLFWQTYYKQCDVIIISSWDYENFKDNINADMTVELKNYNEVSIIFDGIFRFNKHYNLQEITGLYDLYSDMINCWLEDEDEQ